MNAIAIMIRIRINSHKSMSIHKACWLSTIELQSISWARDHRWADADLCWHCSYLFLPKGRSRLCKCKPALAFSKPALSSLGSNSNPTMTTFFRRGSMIWTSSSCNATACTFCMAQSYVSCPLHKFGHGSRPWSCVWFRLWRFVLMSQRPGKV